MGRLQTFFAGMISLCLGDSVEDYMRGTTWFWNNWRDVKFHPDGSFFAPEPHCENRDCTWNVKGEQITIDWGGAGLHFVKLSGDRKQLAGKRFDGDRCSGTFKSKDEGQKCDAGNCGAFDSSSEDYDPYAVLGVEAVADAADIKRAFRKLSVMYHPDKDPSPEAALKFKQIREAYEVIGDEDKRMLFDSGGMELVKDSEKQNQGGGGMDPFAAFFGGNRGGEDRKANKGPDAGLEINIPLEDFYNGNTINSPIRRRVICRGCKNKPQTGNCADCGRCPNEVRTVLRNMGPGFQVQQQEEVPSKHRCKDEEAVLNVVVEKGMSDGSHVTFDRMSEQRPGQIPGDVKVTLRQKKHSTFERQGNDLHMGMTITLQEALLGYSKTVTHLDGRQVEVKSDSVTPPFFTRRLKGEGMPVHQVPSEYGDLFIKFTVAFPTKLSEEEKEFVRKHFR